MTDKPRLYWASICECKECPNYKPLLASDLGTLSAYQKFEDKNLPFGFCYKIEEIITEPLKIHPDCPLEHKDKTLSKLLNA